MTHWAELRQRLLLTCGVMLALMAAVFVFKEPLLSGLLLPLHSVLPGQSVQTTAVAELFFTYVRLAGWGGFLLALPFFFWQLWAFLAPGLYRRERRVLWPALAAVPVLFYAGAAFALFVLAPFILQYLLGFEQSGIVAQPRLADYLSFLFTLMAFTGAAFNLPVVLVLSMALGFVTSAQLAAARKWVVVGVFIVSAIATPPDPFSQTVLAIPLLLLYEMAIVWGKVLEKRSKKR